VLILQRDFCTSSPGVTVFLTHLPALSVLMTVTPGDEVHKYLYKPLPLSRDMKHKNLHDISPYYIDTLALLPWQNINLHARVAALLPWQLSKGQENVQQQ
jgi:hypothetical protein